MPGIFSMKSSGPKQDGLFNLFLPIESQSNVTVELRLQRRDPHFQRLLARNYDVETGGCMVIVVGCQLSREAFAVCTKE